VREREGDELARQKVFPPAPAGKDDESPEDDPFRPRVAEHEHAALTSNVLFGSATEVSDSNKSIVAGATAQIFSLTKAHSPSHMARSTARTGLDRKMAV